uniref:Uncharacterized protein n=1 Tax=Quercus lobata TaxID=97700 RepID=A0A7N2RBE5_QUELO
MNVDSFGLEMESESDLEESGFGGAGITDEVMAFARNIGMHPETWLDFPINEEEDLDELAMDNENRATMSSSSLSNSSAFSFVSKGWREVRDLADADIQLMRHRANSFKNLATSFH